MPAKAYEILGYGVIGLGFLLALLAYRLLTSEQKKAHVRRSMVTAIYIFMGFSFLLCILGLVSELFKKEKPNQGNAQLALENKSLNEGLLKRLSPQEFCPLLNGQPDCQLTKADVLTKVQALILDSSQLKECESHYGFNIFKIEKIMPNYGNSIDTRIPDEQRKEIYKLIQIALRDINAYEGNIEGDPISTSNAVKKFQQAINAQQNSEIFKSENLGIFGYKTLEAIRIAHRTGD